MRFRIAALAALISLAGAHHWRAVSAHTGARRSEVVLSTGRYGHLFLTGESIKLTVSGMPDGETLHLSATDAAGMVVRRQDAVVASASVAMGELPAGWYHVAPEGVSTEGAVDLAVARPRPAPTFRDDSPYGIVGVPKEEKEWPMLAEMGAAWMQWSATWAYMETQPGLYWYMPNFPKSIANPENYVTTANKYGLRTVMQLRSVPRWANKGRIGSYKDKGETRAENHPPDDEHLDAMEKFVGEVVDRFKPLGVHHYEMWSEAEGSLFKGWDTPRFPKIEAYQKMLAHARKAIKAHDSSGMVLAPGDEPVDFLRDVEEGYVAPPAPAGKVNEYTGSGVPGAGKLADIVSGHFYWTDWQSRPRNHYGPEESNPGRKPHLLKEMIEDAKQLAGSRPFWMSEVGYGSAVSGETPDNIGADENEQANLLVRYFLLSRAWGAKKTFWYLWKDRKAADGSLSTSYGLLRPDGTVKPAYTAYRTMTERLEGLPNIKVTESGPNRWIAHLTGPRLVVVIWKLKADGKQDTFVLPWAKVRVTQRDGTATTETSDNGKIKVTLRSGEPIYLDEAP